MGEGERGPRESGRELVRGVLTIVALGAALGLAFNALQLGAGSRRGLAWIHRPTPLANLSAFTPGALVSAAALDSARAARAARLDPAADRAPDGIPPATAVAGSAAKPVVTTPAKPPARTTARPSTMTAQAPRGAATPSPEAAPPAPPPRIALPVVPDTKEPLDVDYAAAHRFWSAGAALFVDARSFQEYAAGHIPGAVNLDFDDVQRKPELAGQIDTRGRPVLVTYCSGGSCELSHHLAIALIQAGHRKVLVFTGGMPAWESGGGPVATGPGRGDAP